MSPTADWRSLYQFASHEIVLDGHRYHYLDEGTGPPLVLVHGNPTWSFYWRELVRGLRGHYRVLVPDHIGCGLSDKPDARSYSYRLAQRVEDLVEWIERLNLDQITLLATRLGRDHRPGGRRRRAERFARFVLLNTAAFRAKACPASIRLCHVPLLGRLMIQGLNLFARAALHSAVEHHDRMTPAVRAGLLAPYDSWQHRVAIDRFVNDIPLRAGPPQLSRPCANRGRAGPVPPSPGVLDLGDAGLVLRAGVSRTLPGIFSRRRGPSPGRRRTLRGRGRPRADRAAGRGFSRPASTRPANGHEGAVKPCSRIASASPTRA